MVVTTCEGSKAATCSEAMTETMFSMADRASMTFLADSGMTPTSSPVATVRAS